MGRTSRTALEAAARDLTELRAMGFVTGDAGKEKILSVWIKLINSFVEDETLIKQLNAEFGSSEIASSPCKRKG